MCLATQSEYTAAKRPAPSAGREYPESDIVLRAQLL
jgi:hypothetical protein